MQNQDYLLVLKQSLTKKLDLLQQIRGKNEEQRVMLMDENLSPEELERNLTSKGELVDQLNLLDEGFDEVYGRVKEELQDHKEDYKEEIQALQDLIRQVTAEGNSIRAEETRNHKLAQTKFGTIKKQIKEVANSYNVVTQYYKNMTKRNYVDPQFLDNKK